MRVTGLAAAMPGHEQLADDEIVRRVLGGEIPLSSEILYAFHDPRCDRVVGNVFQAISRIGPVRLH